MNFHFIAIGGSVMHNLAIALKKAGNDVSGSDDEIFDPALSKLRKYNLLPHKMGWNEENITPNLDAVILGMHARNDNPEIAKAKQLGIPIYSFPEFIYEQSKNKKRVVIGGSHGKTSTTAMIMHVLKLAGKDFDYMVGAQLEGFELTVRLSNSADVIILEGDEYPDSALNKTPKFHLYKADIAVITGIAWDHINVFPTFDLYKEQFRIFAEALPQNGVLIYNKEDETLDELIHSSVIEARIIPYQTPEYKIDNGIVTVGVKPLTPKGGTRLRTNEAKVLPSGEDLGGTGAEYHLEIFGKHNMQNMMAAKLVCNELGISDKNFFTFISSFKGAAKRLELVAKGDSTVIYKDFAHSPSKLKATIAAVKELYPNRKLTACLELHTFSSLNKNFLEEYHGAMQQADDKYVYYNQHTLEHKKLPPLNPAEVRKFFGDKSVEVITDKNVLLDKLHATDWQNRNLLMMSSGNFDGLDWSELSAFIAHKTANNIS